MTLSRTRIEIPDHGYVRLIEAWGGGDAAEDHECGIIEAARQSTQGSFRGWEEDQRLLTYLFNNRHDTPFEFGGMIIEVRAPIFIFREWHRHRTQGYNEASARYAPLPCLNYLPTVERMMLNSKANKQAGAAKDSVPLTEEYAKKFLERREKRYQEFEEEYQEALANGVPKEVARIGMPVGRYSQMRATACLRNWLSFLALRNSPHAQWEIQQYARAVDYLISQIFPRTHALFGARHSD